MGSMKILSLQLNILLFVQETGDLTSRLTTDTTKVGDTMILCLNVFLRNFITAVGVMVFTYIINPFA